MSKKNDKIIESENNTIKLISSMKTIRYIDLCCGIGGFRVAIERYQKYNPSYDFQCVFSADIKDDAIKTYDANFGTDIGKVDINKIKKLPEFDMLCCGFPCFVEGMKVLTNNGYKNIEDVIITDTLLTHTGSFNKILNTQHKTYSGDLYEISVKYHPENIKCTPEHPFYVRHKQTIWNKSLRKNVCTFDEPIWKNACDLTNDDYFGMPIDTNAIIPTFETDIHQNKYSMCREKITLNDKNQWFMMGYFVGNGWIERPKTNLSKYKIRFAISDKNEGEIVSRISQIIPITDKRCNSGKCKRYGCQNKCWFDIFQKFGRYALGKLIPEWVHNAPKELIQEFLEGYIKSDGYINKNGLIQIVTVSYNLAYSIQRLYLKLGYIFSINKTIHTKTHVIEGRTVNQHDIYTVRGKLEKSRFTSFIENNYVWFAPRSITSHGVNDVNVYNFEVDTDNSYVVNNTIVHNCQPFSTAGSKMGFSDARGGIIFKIAEICEKYQPRVILLENVSNLLNLENGKIIKKICKIFDKIGYKISYTKLNALDFGVPQSRERVYIVGCLDKKIDLDNIQTKNHKTLASIIDYDDAYTDIDQLLAKKLLALHADENIFGCKLQDKRGGAMNIHSWDIGWNGDISKKERRLMNLIMTERRKKHWAIKKNIVWMDGMPLTLEEIKTFYDKDGLEDMLANLVSKKYLKLEKCKELVDGKRQYKDDSEIGYNICKGKLSFPISKILDPDGYAPTLTATDSSKLAVIIDENNIRRLSDIELKKLCGFPNGFVIPEGVDKYDLFGNMVVPPVVTAILNVIF